MGAPALVLIDVQQGFDHAAWGQRNNPGAEHQMLHLLKVWRQHTWPVIHVRHASLEPASPLREGQQGFDYKAGFQPLPGEVEFVKHVNSAFIGTNLEHYLRSADISELVIAGLTTDHCVSTSTRMAGNLGYSVRLISDATATFERTGPGGEHYAAETMHAINLASLHGEFCHVVSAADLMRSLGIEVRV